MPNLLNADGLQIASLSEIVDAITLAMQGIFGTDINVGPNTPDGQLINIFAQATEDQLETLLDTYNIFFVDSSYGVILDQLVALNGIARKQGSYTRVYVEVTATQAVTLPGIGASSPFTIADNSGTQYQLIEDYAFAGADIVVLEFQAVLLGQVQVVPNTITSIVTTTLGITDVNNPAFTVTTAGTITNGSPIVTGIADTTGMRPGMLLSSASSFFAAGTTVLTVDSGTQITGSTNATGGSPTTENITVETPSTVVGAAEETDIQLKVRRAQSFYLQTVGPGASIRAAILDVPDVVDCYVAENDTGSPASGVPAHGIWTIVNGGTAAEIGEAINSKKMPGCAQTGAQTYVVAQPQGNSFTAKWDNALPQDLFVEATLNPRIPGDVFDLTADKAALAAALIFKLGQRPSIGDVILAMADIEPNAVLSSVAVSDDGMSWEDIVTPSDFQHYFFLSAANIALTQA